MRSRLASVPWWSLAVVALLCLLHDGVILKAMGGVAGLRGPWPLLAADNGIHYHHAVLSARALRATGGTALYDPSFMAGFAMSAVSDASANPAILSVWALGGTDPTFAYNAYVLVCAGAVPWLLAAAGFAWRFEPSAVMIALILELAYFWTGFPLNYMSNGMLAYLVSVPMTLLATAFLAEFIERGGWWRWLGGAVGAGAVFLAHPTTCMIIAPAAALAYVMAIVEGRRSGRPIPAGRHAGFWAVPVVVVLMNAFWLVPGLRLMSTKGDSAIAFFHPEPVLGRLWEILYKETPSQPILLALALVGLATLWRRDRVAAAGLAGLLASGFGWGYLAGFWRSLDFIQPGRHTYVLYTAATLAAGVGLAEILSRIRAGGAGRLDRWLALALLLIGFRVFAPPMVVFCKVLTTPDSVMSGRQAPHLAWILDAVTRHVKPGERMLYEEGGREIPGVADPFGGRNFSGIVPTRTGVELLGGPYLRIPLVANFTQFGEGKLFGKENWDRAHFERYARLYRPSAILCWTPKARAFCRSNPDLIRILDEDGPLLIGRVIGFEGATIRGTAAVESSPGRLRVSDAKAGGDGLVVLRYHAIPHLRAVPAVGLESVTLEDDPVPFIAFRPVPGVESFELSYGP